MVCAAWMGCAAVVVAAGMAQGVQPAAGGGLEEVVRDEGGVGPRGSSGFVNWETAHVHPLERTPDGLRLIAVNTADASLEVYLLAGGVPVRERTIPVGLDPVSVRARTAGEVWVVNRVSDTVSVVDLSTGAVRWTVKVGDEPGDVAFAGGRAFVSCGTAGQVWVLDAANPSASATVVALEGNEPRAMAVSPDGSKVYVAFFESGNGTTILGGGGDGQGTVSFPPNAVSDPVGPYGGVNPPPNAGAAFDPPKNPAAGTPPAVGLIVKKGADGRWRDDNSGDWTELVSGASAARSGRPAGWDLVDHDVAVIDAATLAVSYAGGMMNICMSLGVNPATGEVAVVGTDALNQVRFEPKVKGTFLRVEMAVMPGAGGAAAVRDLNPHLTYSGPTVPPEVRHLSIGDPRAVVFNAAGTRAYVAGMGSDNVIEVEVATGAVLSRVDVPEGPTGLALDEGAGRLYVMSKFAAGVSVVPVGPGGLTAVEETRWLFDPTPEPVRAGRRHLYSTHANSGLGHIACASCHVDGRTDRLAWDLGDPSGDVAALAGNNLGQGLPGLSPGSANPGFEAFHPMKGPMTTQTLQDIIGHEPLHWRGDRTGLEAFLGAFLSLQGNATTLTAAEMQEFEGFLATVAFPPNPYRNLDNTLPTNMVMTGHYKTGRFGGAGQPLPNGNAQRGLTLYRSTARRLDNNAFACVTCHTLPTGGGADVTFNLGTQRYVPIPPGSNGERHSTLVSVDGSTNHAIKVPQIRNAYKKVGFNTTQTRNTAGFGYLHDGSVDSLERFIAEPVFRVNSDQEVADLAAFVLAISGSELPQGSLTSVFEPPGLPSQDTPASVGTQLTLRAAPTVEESAWLTTVVTLANAGKVGLIAKRVEFGAPRGYAYAGAGVWDADQAGVTVTHATLAASGSAASPLTVTVVPAGAQGRLGIDRDGDGWRDGDERSVCSDGGDPAVFPGGPGCIDVNGDLFIDFFDYDAFVGAFQEGGPAADFNRDGFADFFDYDDFVGAFEAGC